MKEIIGLGFIAASALAAISKKSSVKTASNPQRAYNDPRSLPDWKATLLSEWIVAQMSPFKIDRNSGFLFTDYPDANGVMNEHDRILTLYFNIARSNITDAKNRVSEVKTLLANKFSDLEIKKKKLHFQVSGTNQKRPFIVFYLHYTDAF